MDETSQEKIARLKRLVRALDEAIGSGVRSVYSDGERIEYQSIADMIAARDGFRAELGRMLNAGGRSRWSNYNLRLTMRWS